MVRLGNWLHNFSDDEILILYCFNDLFSLKTLNDHNEEKLDSVL